MIRTAPVCSSTNSRGSSGGDVSQSGLRSPLATRSSTSPSAGLGALVPPSVSSVEVRVRSAAPPTSAMTVKIASTRNDRKSKDFMTFRLQLDR